MNEFPGGKASSLEMPLEGDALQMEYPWPETVTTASKSSSLPLLWVWFTHWNDQLPPFLLSLGILFFKSIISWDLYVYDSNK